MLPRRAPTRRNRAIGRSAATGTVSRGGPRMDIARPRLRRRRRPILPGTRRPARRRPVVCSRSRNTKASGASSAKRRATTSVTGVVTDHPAGEPMGRVSSSSANRCPSTSAPSGSRGIGPGEREAAQRPVARPILHIVDPDDQDRKGAAPVAPSGRTGRSAPSSLCPLNGLAVHPNSTRLPEATLSPHGPP